MSEKLKKELKKVFDNILNKKFEHRTDDGVQFPREAYLYAPDPDNPSEWKLRIWEDLEKKVTRTQLGRAAAAFSPGGFRGQKVQLPSEVVKGVKDKLVALYKKDGAKDEEIPSYLFEEIDNKNKKGGEFLMDEKKLIELEKKIEAMEKSGEKDKKILDEKHKTDMDSLKKELDEKYKTQSEDSKKELEETNKRLADTDKKLADRDVELHKERVDKRVKVLLEDGFWPAVVAKVKIVMLADSNGKFGLIKLDEKKDASEISLSETLIDILNTIPKEVRLDFLEITSQETKLKTGKKFMTSDEVDKYALENKISYEAACAKLSEEGKIEHVSLQ